MHYRYDAYTDPAAFMGVMILESLRLGEPTDIDDILPCRYDEITLPMLGAALFERGWIRPGHRSIYPIDTLALGDHSWGGQILPLAKSGENTLLNV